MVNHNYLNTIFLENEFEMFYPGIRVKGKGKHNLKKLIINNY